MVVVEKRTKYVRGKPQSKLPSVIMLGDNTDTTKYILWTQAMIR